MKPDERFPFSDTAYPPRMSPWPKNKFAFVHGLLESIARVEAHVHTAIEERGECFPKQIFTASGRTFNSAWTKIRARHLGIMPTQAKHTEAAQCCSLIISHSLPSSF